MFEDIDDYRVLINLSQRDNLFSDGLGRVKVQLAFCEISAYLASSLPRFNSAEIDVWHPGFGMGAGCRWLPEGTV